MKRYCFRTMFTIVMLMIAGQMWAADINLGAGTVNDGSLKFYSSEACTDEIWEAATGATVYIKASPNSGYTGIGLTMTAECYVNSAVAQARRRAGASLEVATVAVSAVTGKPGIYMMTLPTDAYEIVKVSTSFVEAATQQVSYVDENYQTRTARAIVLDETMASLDATKVYVVSDGLTINHDIYCVSSSGTLTIIVPDGKTLSLNTVDISDNQGQYANAGFHMGCGLSFYGQTNATGKVVFHTKKESIGMSGALTVAHLDMEAACSAENAINAAGGVVFAGHQTKGNSLTVRSAGTGYFAAITGGGNPVTIKNSDVEVTGYAKSNGEYVGCSGSGILGGGNTGVTITGLADGSNTVKIRTQTGNSSFGGIYCSDAPVTITNCDVDIIQSGFGESKGIYGGKGVTITGLASGSKVNKLTVRSDGYGMTSGSHISINYCDVEMTGVNQNNGEYDGCTQEGLRTNADGINITGRADGSNKVVVRSNGNGGIYAGSCPLNIKYCDVDVFATNRGYAYAIFAGGTSGVNIEGVATGNKVNKITVRSASNGIYGGGGNVSISYCDVEVTNTTKNADGDYDFCSRNGINAASGSTGVTMIGRADGSNKVTVRSVDNAIYGAGQPVTIKYYDVEVFSNGSGVRSDGYDVYLEGVATGNKVNKITVHSDNNSNGGSIYSGGKSNTIKYYDVEVTGATKNAAGEYNPCGNVGLQANTKGLILIGLDNVGNKISVRSNYNALNASGTFIDIKNYDVDVVSTNSYGLLGSSDDGVSIASTLENGNTIKVKSGGPGIFSSGTGLNITNCTVDVESARTAMVASRHTASNTDINTNINIIDSKLTVTCTGVYEGSYASESCGIIAPAGLTIDGSQVTVSAPKGYAGIYAYRDGSTTIADKLKYVTFSWKNASDFIMVDSYQLEEGYTLNIAEGKRFRINDGTTVCGILESGAVADPTALNGKKLTAFSGNTVTIPASGFAIIGKTSPDFTVGGIPYYIFDEGATVKVGYTGSDFVQVDGQPGDFAAVEDEPMQRTFTMGVQDVTLTAAAVSGLAVSGTYTYDGTAQTPAFKLGDNPFAAENYDINAHEDWINAGNYTMTITGKGQYFGSKSGLSFTIDPRSVTVSAISAENKVYDGTADVTIDNASADFDGKVEGDVLTISGITGTFGDANVGSGKTVTLNYDNAVLGGEGVANYSFADTGNLATTTADITQKPLTVTADSDTKVYDTTPLTKDSYTSTALAEGDAFESVTVTGSQTVVGESGNVASAAVIRNGNGDDVTDCYAITYVSGTLTVTTATMTGISATDYEAEYDGAAHTITMTGVPEGATVTFGDRPSAVTSAKAPVYTSVVERTVYWKVVKDNYYDVTGSATVKISRKPLTITADSETKVYDGTALKKNSYTSTALADGDRIVRVTVTGSQTNVGECENVPSAAFIRNASSWDMTSNYAITYVSGTLEVTTATMTGISATGYEGIYDGASHSLTVTGVPEGATVTYGESEDDISGTEVPTYTDVVDKTIYWKVAKANYYDVTGHAAMKITAKDVTITAQDKVFAYTGNVQSWPEYDVDGLVGSDAITAVVTGSITYPSEGTVANVVESYEFTSGTPGNYSVTTQDGVLTMTNASAAITITAASESWTYDGETHANNTVTVTEGELLEGDVLVAEATGSVTNVADTKNRNNPIAAGYKVMNGTEDVTDNYAITAVAGKLEVMPKAVTISGVTVSDKTYDGTTTAKLNTDNYVIEGKVEADNLVIRISKATADFVDKNVGTNKEIIITGIVLGGSARGNYTLAEQPQGLTATISKKILSVTANDMTISYGDEPDNDGVRYTGFASGESESDLDGNLTYTYNTASNGKGSAYTAGSPVGTYYIIPKGLSSGNYRFIYRKGELTVEEKVIDYADGTITQDENGYTVNLDEGEGSANELPDDDDLANLTYSRTLTPPGNGSGEVQIDGEAANLYTVCLPFAPLADGHVKYYTLSRVSGETIFFNEVTTAPVSHTPYLVAVMGSANFKERCADVEVGSMEINSTTVDGYTFTGTFTGLTNDQAIGKYILQHGNRWGLVTTEKTDARIPPFRAYVESASGVRLLTGSLDGEATGIKYIRTTDADGSEQWYDLNGRRISKPTKKGVYIHNGRKEAVK